MVILVSVLGILALWIWKVSIPQKASDQKLREADKEIHQTNAATLSKLTEITGNINTTTTNSNTTLRAIIEVKEIELELVGKVAIAAGCDVRTELAECRGVLRAVREGATIE